MILQHKNSKFLLNWLAKKLGILNFTYRVFMTHDMLNDLIIDTRGLCECLRYLKVEIFRFNMLMSNK